jgi:hypothetical protein
MTKASELENAASLEKEPTETHEAFVDYVKETTGYSADLRTVQLAFVLRGKFQNSPQSQEAIAARAERVAAEQAAREEEREAAKAAAADKKAKAPAKKTVAKKAAPAKKASAAPARRKRPAA